MSVPILTAIADAASEADLAGALSHDDHGVLVVVRRCVDLADLLAAASAGLARAVVLSGDLRRLDRDAISRLALARVAVVGLVAAGDEAAERRLRQLGVTQVLPRDAPPDALAASVHAAIGELASAPSTAADLGWADPVRELPPTPAADSAAEALEPPGPGRVIAVWGPAGAPGRSTIAVNVAAELAALGQSVLLVDADTYGGAIAQLIGVLDEAPGLAAACRLANSGTLDVARLAELAVRVRPDLRVLTGITRAERWLELRPAALRVVLDLARSLVAITVVDCGFCLEQDEELSYDTAAPRRNGATLSVLAAADHVVGVAAADPVGLARYVRALPDCAGVAGCGVAPTVVNRLRDKVVGPGDARRQVSRALDRYAGIANVHVVPEDRSGLDAALAAGRTLAEAAPKSPARLAIRDLAATIAGQPDRKRGRREKQRRVP